MRSTVGVLLVALGILFGAQGFVRWSQGNAPVGAMVESPAVVPAPWPRPRDTASAAPRASSALGSPSPVGALAALEPALAPRRFDATQAVVPRNLARELQRALRRARCYGGAINGTWTPATRKAMQAFLAQVNAALPVDKPDIVLLALLQNEPDALCGCPAGQRRGGACLPVAMLSHAAPPASTARPARLERRSTGGAAAASAAPIAGRMGIGGPRLARTEAPGARNVRPAGAQSARVRDWHAAPRHGRQLALAHHHRQRPTRIAYRPVRRSGGVLGWLFGGWPF